MTVGQSILLAFTLLFGVLTLLFAFEASHEVGSAMPVGGLLFWACGGVTLIFMIILGLAFVV